MKEEQILLNIEIPPPSPRLSLSVNLPQEGGAVTPPAPPPPNNNRVKCVVSVSPCLLLINSEKEEDE